MKKILLVIALLFLSLTGCNNENKNEEVIDQFEDKTSYSLAETANNSWIATFDKENVSKIRIEKGGIGVRPDSFAFVYYSTDKSDIEYNVDILFSELTKTEKEPMDGGSYIKVTYYTNDNYYSITFNNNRISLNSDYELILNKKPNINNISSECNNIITSTATIYASNGNEIKRINDLDEYEFIEDDTIILNNQSPYRIKIYSSRESIYIYDKDILVIDDVKYRIINNEFSYLNFN